MDQLTTNGIITRITPFRETDVIGTILSENFGKIDFIARNSAKSRVRFAGGLNLFDVACYELTAPRGNSSLYQLVASSNLVSIQITRSIATFNAASLAVEIASEFSTSGDSSNSMIFALLLAALKSIASGNVKTEVDKSTCEFINQMLHYSGLLGEPNEVFQSTEHRNSVDSAIHNIINRQLDFCEHYLGRPLKTRRNLFA